MVIMAHERDRSCSQFHRTVSPDRKFCRRRTATMSDDLSLAGFAGAPAALEPARPRRADDRRPAVRESASGARRNVRLHPPFGAAPGAPV
jgi:hypothetical protein